MFVMPYQVERRVVNKLAAAHERQLINEGSTVRLVTDYRGTDMPESPGGHRIELEILEAGKGKVLDLPNLTDSVLESTCTF